MPKLRGKVVIITGAGSGIGYHTALRFAKKGAKLVLADVRGERALVAAQEIEASGGEAVAVEADVSKREQVDAMVQAAVDRFGRVDVLVNNAGYGMGASVEQTTEEGFRDLWETNVLGVLFGMQAVLPIMQRQRSGHIINVSSAAGKIAYPGIAAYAATKHAVAALTDALRAEVAGTGIHASTVFPIGTRTEFFRSARLAEGGTVGPHGPMQSPEHVARRIVACAKRPTLEVLPYRPLRIGIVVQAIFPALMAFIQRRGQWRQPPAGPVRKRAEIAQEEVPHGQTGR
jgi:NAD(P)-dependent dehydrogenase (short-subunit alcohol dehydrogenase family)